MASSRIQVLFVEDSLIDARLIERTVSRAAHHSIELQHVTDLRTALAELQKTTFDAVLLDVILPDSPGAVESIRALHNVAPEIPVIVLTGMEDTEAALLAVRGGAQDYLVKEQCNPDTVIRAIGYALERVQHAADQRALREAENQLSIAARIQAAKLPGQPPLAEGYDIGAECLPATASGGDYFDFLPTEPGYLCVAVGDASGHGLGPAMVMSDVRAVLRTLATSRSDPAEILRMVNQIAVRDLGVSVFMTLMLVRLELASGLFQYVGAGHSGLLLSECGDVRTALSPSVPPLNVVAELDAIIAEEQLAIGETLLLFTDGITDSQNKGTIFGSQRLLEFTMSHQDESAAAIASGLVRRSREFANPAPQEDDMTAVVVRRRT
jgi:sigma-B regulation protein RsbU (phosphoserine phosphatase)